MSEEFTCHESERDILTTIYRNGVALTVGQAVDMLNAFAEVEKDFSEAMHAAHNPHLDDDDDSLLDELAFYEDSDDDLDEDDMPCHSCGGTGLITCTDDESEASIDCPECGGMG